MSTQQQTHLHTDATAQLCTFVLDGVLFGIEVKFVQEVLRLQEMTPVPLSSNVVAGLINLRGHIVTALDLRVRLGLPSRAVGQEPVNVVVRQPDGTISLLVDDIGDVVHVDAASFEQTPATLDARIKAVVRGVYKLKGELLLLMDPALAVDVDATGESIRAARA